MARVISDPDRSLETFSSLIQLQRSSTSRSTSGFPHNCLSLSISINYQYSQQHPSLSYQMVDPSSHLDMNSSKMSSNSSFTNFQLVEASYVFQNSQEESQEEFVWMEDPEESGSEEQDFINPNDFSFSASSVSNRDIPFFGSNTSGLSRAEIDMLPVMTWGAMHNKFNKGQKCSVCLQDFGIGNQIRVMTCLHRFHVSCVDQWLENKPNCPNCRRKIQRKSHFDRE